MLGSAEERAGLSNGQAGAAKGTRVGHGLQLQARWIIPAAAVS